MYQIQQQQQNSPYSPNKVTGSCFRCNKPGHWANKCPENPSNRSPISSSSAPTTTDRDFPSMHCQCGAGLCEIRVSGSRNNPGRKYYRCPGKNDKHCGYFKWCDQLRREERRQVQPESFPICGCGAGICSVKVEESGVNAGRSYFACPIRKGDGACNFRQWVDYSPESMSIASEDAIQRGSISDFDLSSEAEMEIDALEMGACEEVQVQMEDEIAGGDRGPSVGTPDSHPDPVMNRSENLDSGVTTQSSDILQNSMGNPQMENVQASVTPVITTVGIPVSQDPSVPILKHLVAYLLNEPGWPGCIPCLLRRSVKIAAVSSFCDIAMPEDNVSVSPVSPKNSSPTLEVQPCAELHLDDSSHLKDGLGEGCIMTGATMQAFEKLAVSLRNDLITLLESMGPHDHENMRKEADCTFAAFDSLQVDYGLLQLRVNEYIKQAAILTHIEKNIHDDAFSQELLNRYNKEQSHFREIFHAYCEAWEAFMASNKQLGLLSEKAACATELLAETEVELSCCEAETAAHRDRLLQITKTMVECKESLQAASREATDALVQSEKREIERNAAKAAFEKARTQLRN